MSLEQAIAETEALRALAAFPLVEALFGRRSRRFALGGAIPDGPLAYRSRREPLPLSELEPLGARFPPRPASTPPSCSSPTTPVCTSSRPVMPVRSSIRPPTG
jgi:hypothetical protein